MNDRRTAWNSTLPAPEKRIESGGPIGRKARLRTKGGSRFPERRDPEYTAWIITLPCLLAGGMYGWKCCLKVDPAHVFKTRGAGAYDHGEVVPLCRIHHVEQEGRTEAFNAKYGVDLRAEARRLQRVY